LTIVLGLVGFVVADGTDDLAMALLQCWKNVLAHAFAHERNEGVEAAGDLLSLQNAKVGGDDRELVGGNLALLAESAVESLAFRLQALQDRSHLGPRGWSVAGEEGVKERYKTSGEAGGFGETALRTARVDGGGPLFDDGGGEEATERRRGAEIALEPRAEGRVVRLWRIKRVSLAFDESRN
jgi:hypothetical protein